MGNLDSSNKIHVAADEFHKKHEDINMHGRSIDNLKTICVNKSTNSRYAVNIQCLAKLYL